MEIPVLTFFHNYYDPDLFILRLAVGVIFLHHGWPKLKKSKVMAQGIGIPVARVFVLGLVEIFSSFGMIFGILVNWAAVLLSIVMLGAIYLKIKKWHVPFSATNTTGWELDLILLAANLAILFLARF